MLTAPSESMSLSGILAGQAQSRADQMALRFLEAGEGEGLVATEWTYADLHRRALELAAHLAQVTEPGDRALLLCPPGLDYVAALFACFYAGVIAVPAYPPMSTGVDRRLEVLCRDCTPTALMTTQMLSSVCAATLDRLIDDARLSLILVDVVQDGEQAPHRGAGIDDVALLQYTSGSTGDPRGVVLSHRNILANVQAIVEQGQGSSADRGVFWLPPYHDMGLIGGIFTPIVAGAQTTLMSPLTFLADPVVWLQALTRYEGTFSAAPNFAYDLCAAKTTQEAVTELDLSSWRIAISGAEPVQHATVKRFTDRFRGAGFDPDALMPCYGLAEATLLVSGVRLGEGVSAIQLPDSEARDFAARPAGEVVSVGVPAKGSVVAIADAEGRRCQEDEVGEIWVQSPCVASGYWAGKGDSEATFGGQLADAPGQGPFLRTGDLGIWHDGELYIAGRLKDVIIVRGRNYYPHDIEAAIAVAEIGLRPGCAAVFAVSEGAEQRIVAVAEARGDVADLDHDATERAAREAVAREFGLSLWQLVVIERGKSLKTSSGKIRRRPTREAYESGMLGESRAALEPVGHHRQAAGASELPVMLASAMAEILGAASVGPADDFLALGADSLNAVELAVTASAHGAQVQAADVYRFPTAHLLAQEILRRRSLGDGEHGGESALARMLRSPIGRVRTQPSYPLSPIQRRWAADYLADRTKTWGNLTLRIALPDGGSRGAVERAVAEVWAAHDSLRTVFSEQQGELRQAVQPSVEVPISEHDLADVAPAERSDAAGRIVAREAAGVFDLASGPLARVALIGDGRSAELVLTLHHMIADGWSLLQLREQLGAAYARGEQASQAALDGTGSVGEVRYRDYAAWMNELEASDALADARDYWRAELAGPLPSTLAVEERLARSEDTIGASCLMVLPSDLAMAVKDAAIASRRSLSAWLLAAFFCALRRQGAEQDLIVGTPLAGRDRKDIKNVVGMFINLVPIRVKWQPQWDFNDAVAAVHEKLIGAVTHQRYQLDRMMGDLGIEREPHRFAITNTFFSRMSMGEQALGPQAGACVSKDLPVDVRYQVMLYVYDFADGLIVDCRYRKALFEQARIAALVEDYVAVLREAIAR
jgi:acyl-CoA synthetase (AMP-forming)/AMP-acid ligase II